MKRQFTGYLLIALLMTSVLGCSDDDSPTDVAPPTAIITQPVEGRVYMRGGTLMLSADFESELGLKECTAYLKESTQLKGWNDPWLPEQTLQLTGSKDNVENQYLFEPVIPSDIKSTDYLFVLLVVDIDLNYTTYEIPITIK